MKSKTHIAGATIGLLLLIILLSADAHAQNYSVKMVSPDTLQNNSRTVSIRVETTHPIDSSSIEWDTFGPDSMFVAHPTVMLIPSYIYHDTTFSASNWYKHSIIGDISMPADTILMYSVSNLHNGMSFVVLVTGIELEDSLGVSHAANELVHEFTIAEPLPFYQGSSLGAHRTIFPDDTITVYFSAKVEETYTQNGKVSTSLGPIVEIEQHQGYSWDSLTQRYQELRKRVESESWLGVDNHTIHVVLDTAATPITDEWMYLEVNAGYLNGDTLTNNIEDPFGIITSYSVVLSAENALQTDTLPNWLGSVQLFV